MDPLILPHAKIHSSWVCVARTESMTYFETLDVVGVQKHEIRLEKDTMQEGSFKSSKDSPLRFPAAVPDPLGLCGSNHFQPCNLLSCQMGGLMQKNDTKLWTHGQPIWLASILCACLVNLLRCAVTMTELPPQKIVTNMEKSTDHDGLQGSLPSPEAPAENSALGALSRSGCTWAFISCKRSRTLPFTVNFWFILFWSVHDQTNNIQTQTEAVLSFFCKWLPIQSLQEESFVLAAANSQVAWLLATWEKQEKESSQQEKIRHVARRVVWEGSELQYISDLTGQKSCQDFPKLLWK